MSLHLDVTTYIQFLPRSKYNLKFDQKNSIRSDDQYLSLAKNQDSRQHCKKKSRMRNAHNLLGNETERPGKVDKKCWKTHL